MAVAPGPLPTMTSTRKSSMAMYSSSSAGRAMRWISSTNSTSPSPRLVSIAARSPARSIAGPLVTRIGVTSSVAMIIARLVLPNPGGPDSRMWSGARWRRRALSSTSSSCSRTFGWPGNSASRLGRRLASTSRSSGVAIAETTASTAGESASGAVAGDGRSLNARAREAGCCGAGRTGDQGEPHRFPGRRPRSRRPPLFR